MSSLHVRVTDADAVKPLTPIMGWQSAADVSLWDSVVGLGLPHAKIFIETAVDAAEDFVT